MKKTFFYTVICLAMLIMACSKGEQGPAGNANVYGSGYYNVNWLFDNNQNIYHTKIDVPQITQDIVDNGLVQVFVLYGNEWWALPDLNGVNSTIYGIGLGYVSLINSNSDLTVPSYPSNSTFRVVVISSYYKKAMPQVNWKNYKEVKIALNLND